MIHSDWLKLFLKTLKNLKIMVLIINFQTIYTEIRLQRY